MTPDEIVKDLHDADLCDDTEKYRLCIKAADLIESLQTQLADYHHMSELVDGKMEENARLRKIVDKLTARAEKAEAERDAYKEALAHLEHMVSVERDGNRKREHSIGVVVAIKRARDAPKGA